MNKEEFIKQRCEIDKITLEEFNRKYKVVECKCGAPYCHGYRCVELDDVYKQALNEIREKFELKIKENQDLIERLTDTSSFRIGNAQSKIKDYREFLQIVNKVLGDER